MKNTSSRLASFIVLALLALVIAIAGCKKKDNDEEETPTPTPAVEDISAEQDFTIAEVTAGDANRESDIVLKDTLFYKTSGDQCVTVSKTGSGSCDTTIRILYNDCMDLTNNILRNGEIEVRVQGCKYKDLGTVITIKFKDFYMNQYKLNGTRILTNLGNNAMSQKEFQAQDIDCKVADISKLEEIRWNTYRKHTWVKEDNIKPFTDFILRVDSMSGDYLKYKNGTLDRRFKVEIDSLIRTICPFPIDGTVKITRQDLSTNTVRTVDFGYPNYANPQCDDSASVTVGSQTFNISIIKR